MAVGSTLKKVSQMGQVHGSNILSGRRFLERCINSFLMQTGIEEILQFRKYLIRIGLELYLQPGAMFERLLAEAAKGLEVQQVGVIDRNEPMRLLQHKSFSNDVGVNLIRLCLSDVVFSEGRGLDRVYDTDLMPFINKETNKVVAVVGR